MGDGPQFNVETPEAVKQLSEMFLMVPCRSLYHFSTGLHDACHFQPSLIRNLAGLLGLDAWWLDLSLHLFPEILGEPYVICK